MRDDDSPPARLRWARLRFSIIGPLLAEPLEHGDLAGKLAELAGKSYRHPTRDEAIRFGASTIERWYYAAKDANDPLVALARKVPKHAGAHPAMPARLLAALETQYRQHPRWSMQLHHDNLLALVREDPSLGPMPSYTTICRVMKDRAWLRDRRRQRRGRREAPAPPPRETRSFEVTHVHALWHLDFHEGSRQVILPSGERRTPLALGVLDDRSRLACHLQWYLDETTETLCHGFGQAIQKRGLPRGLLSDNGSAMLAAEFTEGLAHLGITHYTTLPMSPQQNAKQEVFWAQLEGRLVAMLEGEPELTLALLNQATQAWVELEYQRKRHDELGGSPLDAALAGPSAVRPSPSSETLRRAFRLETSRAVRRSDGTFTVLGVRYELPWAYRHLPRVTVRVARWDLSSVDLVDPRTGTHLAALSPLDKAKNADGRRRAVPEAPAPPAAEGARAPAGIAPHLRRLMADYAATGLPPAYLPLDVETASPVFDAPLDPDPDPDEEDPR